MADDQTINPVPWWATGGPARVTVRPYQPAASESGDSNGWIPWTPQPDAWFPNDWVPASAPAQAPDSDDQNAAGPPISTSLTDLTNAAIGTRYLDPFTQFLIAALARAPAATKEPPVSPELSNAVAWGLPIFPKDILGFDPNKIPASQWPTTAPIFLQDWLSGSGANPSPSPWPSSPARAQGDQSSFVPDMGPAATHSLLALTAPKQAAASNLLPAPGTYPGLFPPPPSIAANGRVLPFSPDGSLAAADLDAATRALATPNLPVSRSTGAPYFPPPVQPTISGTQWREIGTGAGSLIAPNLTDYLTNTSPTPVYPTAPGKIPRVAPDPVGAIIDIAALGAAPEERAGIGVAGKAATVVAESADAAAAKGMEDAALALRARRAAQLKVNQANGARFEDETVSELSPGDTAGRQLTLETPPGTRTRLDVMTRSRETGEINCLECKASDTAPVRPAQRDAHSDIERYGATIVGKGKPGFPGGMKIPPTSVEIRRPRK